MIKTETRTDGIIRLNEPEFLDLERSPDLGMKIKIFELALLISASELDLEISRVTMFHLTGNYAHFISSR